MWVHREKRTLFSRLQALVEEGDESVGVSTDELVKLLAVLEQHEGGHGTDAELLAQLGKVIDVDLGEEDILVLLVVGVAGKQTKSVTVAS